MSCTSLNQGQLALSVAMGMLPEGFCPENMQELANAIAERLIVTPSQTASSSFAIGSIEPTSNVGPWLKDCEEWWFYDDSLSRYVIQPKTGFNQLVVISTSQDFQVPENITRIKIEGWGGGGGGMTVSGTNNGGGGAGGYGLKFINVTPGQIIPIVVGTGGAGGSPGANGGDTTFDGVTCGGGLGAPTTDRRGGAGGSVTGADYSIPGGNGDMGDTAVGGHGGETGGGGGAGGSVTNVAADSSFRNGVVPGGGGAGGTSGTDQDPGDGANGIVLIHY